MSNQQPDFFSDVESLSPRLMWMKRHAVVTAFDQGLADEGNEQAWSCYRADLKGDVTAKNSGVGATETEAILDFCLKHNVTHWSQEQPL